MKTIGKKYVYQFNTHSLWDEGIKSLYEDRFTEKWKLLYTYKCTF